MLGGQTLFGFNLVFFFHIFFLTFFLFLFLFLFLSVICLGSETDTDIELLVIWTGGKKLISKFVRYERKTEKKRKDMKKMPYLSKNCEKLVGKKCPFLHNRQYYRKYFIDIFLSLSLCLSLSLYIYIYHIDAIIRWNFQFHLMFVACYLIIIVGKEISDPSSNPGRSYLYFTSS